MNWNGAYRTTTFVDAGHLTVAIPASDLATAGSATITVANPGAVELSPDVRDQLGLCDCSSALTEKGQTGIFRDSLKFFLLTRH